MDNLTNDELESWELGISSRPHVHCWDVASYGESIGHCCSACHNAESAGKTSLLIQEIVGRIQVETWLCCVSRKYWHSLSIVDKFELIWLAEDNPDRLEYVKLNEELVRNILLAVEAAIEADDDYSRALRDLSIPGNSRDEITDQICLLAEAGFVEAESSASEQDLNRHVRRLTAKGWQFLGAVRDAEVWSLTREKARQAGDVSLQSLFELAGSMQKARARGA